MDCNLKNLSVNIGLAQLCLEKTYGILNLNQEDAIECVSFAKLIEEQWEKNQAYLLALVQDVNKNNLHYFDGLTVLQLNRNSLINPLTNCKVANLFFFSVKPIFPDNVPHCSYLGYTNYTNENFPQFGKSYPKEIPFPLAELNLTEEISAPKETKSSELKFEINCFAPLDTYVSIDLEDIEFFSQMKYGDLINAYKSKKLPFVLAIVQDKGSTFLSCFKATSLNLNDKNPKTNSTINKVFYYLIAGENNSIDYLGHAEGNSGKPAPFIDLHLNAMEGSAECEVAIGDHYQERKNFEKAFSWYASAAQKNCSEGRYRLAVAYMDGEGVAQNYDIARQELALIQSTSKFYVNAQLCLGICHYELNSYEKSVKTLSTLLNSCKNYRYASKASYYLGASCLRLENFGDAKKAFKSIGKKKKEYADAQFFLGMTLLAEMDATPTSKMNSAFHFFKAAANLNHSTAQFWMGTYYQNGVAIPKDLQKAFEYFKLSADQGYSNAICALGKCYQEGMGVSRDLQKAFEHFTLAADKGDEDAHFQLGLCHQQGLYVPQDLQKAAHHYKTAADMGNANAQFKLGIIYKLGLGFPKDLEEAFRYYKMAADNRNGEAQYQLYLCYNQGLGVAKNLKEAIHYCKMAADNGNVAAQFNMGVCYMKGTGVGKDSSKAVHYLKLSADKGNASAQSHLGICYMSGIGVPQNYNQAVDYFKLATDQGELAAQCNLGACYLKGHGIVKNSKVAVGLFKLAADQGFSAAQFNLANCYFYGEGAVINRKEAARYFEMSAKQENAEAQLAIAKCYIRGEGVSKNIAKGVHYLKMSADQNNDEAQFELGYAYFQGEIVPEDRFLAIRYFKMAADNGNTQAKKKVLYLTGR